MLSLLYLRITATENIYLIIEMEIDFKIIFLFRTIEREANNFALKCLYLKWELYTYEISACKNEI